MLTAPHHLTNSFDFCKAKLIQEEQQQWHNMAPWSVRPPMTLVNGFRHNIFTAQPFHDPRKNHWNQTLHSKRHKDASPVSWGKANIIQDILWPSLGLTVKWYFPFAFVKGGDSQWRQGMKGCWQITLFPAVHLWFGGWIHPDLNGPFSSGGSFNGINYLRAPQLALPKPWRLRSSQVTKMDRGC